MLPSTTLAAQLFSNFSTKEFELLENDEKCQETFFSALSCSNEGYCCLFLSHFESIPRTDFTKNQILNLFQKTSSPIYGSLEKCSRDKILFSIIDAKERVLATCGFYDRNKEKLLLINPMFTTSILLISVI